MPGTRQGAGVAVRRPRGSREGGGVELGAAARDLSSGEGAGSGAEGSAAAAWRGSEPAETVR